MGMGLQQQYSTNPFATLSKNHCGLTVGSNYKIPKTATTVGMEEEEEEMMFGCQEHRKHLLDPRRIVEEFSKEPIKNTMLKQESTFKEQVVELHRLYGVQKIMMSEMSSSGIKISGEKKQPLMMITGIKVSNQLKMLNYPKFDEKPNLRVSDDCGIDLDLSLSIGCGGNRKNSTR